MAKILKVKAESLVCTIISLVEREKSRKAVVKQLERIGLEPHIIESDPREDMRDHGNHFSNAQASAKAIEFALEAKSDLLFCEDDIEIGRHFAAFVNNARALYVGKIVYFYAHDKVDRMGKLYENTTKVMIKAKQHIEPDIIQVQTNRYLPFTQCVLIPFRHLEKFDLEQIKEGTKSFDLWLMREYIQKNNILPHMALPHPVQHLRSHEGAQRRKP